MRVADYIFDYFYSKGVDTVFMLVGGGSMYLNDAVSKSKMNVICCHHEQAAAYAAVGYAKYVGKPAIVLTTTGCGATNTITGMLDAWQDSVPVIFISGQVKTKDMSHGNVRQIGIQEANIEPIISSIVKHYAYPNVLHVEKITFESGLKEYIRHGIPDTLELDVLFSKCIKDRKGPVFLEVPLDIQCEEI